MPERARLEVGKSGAFTAVTTEALAPGDILIVFPGDKFPVDGLVVSGTSSCNEAALTGEPMPTMKIPGMASLDRVLAQCWGNNYPFYTANTLIEGFSL